MIGLIIAIILFNTIAFSTNRLLSKNQIVTVWLFIVTVHNTVDVYLSGKHKGYWYFGHGIEYETALVLTLLIPPVAIIFLNKYPFRASLIKQVLYVLLWCVFSAVYELTALLEQPYGYFNYGWWNIRYSIICYPFLYWLVLGFYKWIDGNARRGINYVKFH